MSKTLLVEEKKRRYLSFPIISSLLLILNLVLNASMINAPVQASEYSKPIDIEHPYLKIVDETAEKLLIEFTPPEVSLSPQTKDDLECQEIRITGINDHEERNRPVVPEKVFLIGVPQNAEPVLRIVDVDKGLVMKGLSFCPMTEPVFEFDADIPARSVGSKFSQIDRVDELYPETIANIISSGYIRSQRYIQVRLNPVQINSETGELLSYQKIVIEIDFHTSNNGEVPQHNNIPEPYFELTLQDLLINYEQAKDWRIRSEKTDQGVNALRSDPLFYKIMVNEDGIYQLTYTDLQAAGLPVDDLDPRTFQLFNQDNEAAIYIEGENDGVFDPTEELMFYGVRNRTKYSDTNIYWLTWGMEYGLRMTEVDGTSLGSAPIPLEFLTQIELEENTDYYSDIPSGVDKDFWYWSPAFTGIDPQAFTFELPHLSLQSHTITLRGLIVGLYGLRPTIEVFINDDPEPIFSGRISVGPEFTISADFSQSLLVDGTNTLSVGLLNPDDYLFVNRFLLEYYGAYKADADRLFFTEQTGAVRKVIIDGFSNNEIDTFDITDPMNPKRIVNSTIDGSDGDYSVSFEIVQPAISDYLAVTGAARLSAAEIIQDVPSQWRIPNHQADYIIISHADFLDALAPLVTLRENGGLAVAVVDIQDIYDEFNGGIFSPEAIRSFLTYTYENWESPAPAYVLLVGDGHYDYQDFTYSGKINYIPPFMDDLDPWIGNVASDNWFVRVSGTDILPDMAIGRFPVNSVVEAQTMVQKLVVYEQDQSINDWNSRLTFIADNADTAGDFAQESDLAASFVPSDYTVEKIYYGLGSFTNSTTTRNALITAINQGRLLVHYNGHGSIIKWAIENLLSVTYLSSLVNGDKLPFVMPMTCSEGIFIDLQNDGLGESIVRKNGGGAIASWSPAGFGATYGHALLDASLLDNLFGENYTELGYLTTQAKYELFAQTSSFNDLIHTYTLFGDPALHLRKLPVTLPAPSNLTAVAADCTHVELNWQDNSMDESAFRIERSVDGISGWQQIGFVDANETSYVDEVIDCETNNYYRVIAFREGDLMLSEYSNVANDPREYMRFYLPLILWTN